MGAVVKDYIPELVTMLGDPDPEVRMLTLYIIGKLGKIAKNSDPVLIPLLGDTDSDIQETATSELRNIDVPKEHVPTFIASLKDIDLENRYNLFELLISSGPHDFSIVSHILNKTYSHSTCNLNKGDHLIGKHYMEKLISRNENIMGSNHPWKKKILEQLGSTPLKRRSKLEKHYDNVHQVLGDYYWGGIESYHPETDPFYRSLITQLNKR